jgi:hypothetical protein
MQINNIGTGEFRHERYWHLRTNWSEDINLHPQQLSVRKTEFFTT